MDTYTKRERTIYLLGMLGQNLIYGVIGTGLTYYFQSVIFCLHWPSAPSPCYLK